MKQFIAQNGETRYRLDLAPGSYIEARNFECLHKVCFDYVQNEMTRCSIEGCPLIFETDAEAELHAANTWHCVSCGFSDNRELTNDNINTPCPACGKPKTEYI